MVRMLHLKTRLGHAIAVSSAIVGLLHLPCVPVPSPNPTRPNPPSKQHNGFNCGPIACLKVMEIYGLLPQNSIKTIRHSPYGYRGVVMEYYVAFLEKYDSDIHYLITTTGAKKFKKIVKESAVDEEEEDDGATSVVSMNCSIAMTKKNKRQEESAKKAMKQCGDAAIKSGVAPGAIVSLQVDYRTHYNPEGLVAVVYNVQMKTGGIKVCCQHGAITHDGKKATTGCLQINTSSKLPWICFCHSRKILPKFAS